MTQCTTTASPPIHKSGLIGSLCTLLLIAACLASMNQKLSADQPIPEGWFVWPFEEARMGSAIDNSALNHKPAGSRGQVVVRDGVFVTSDDGERIRFWGCNLSSNEAFVDADTADRLALRLAQGGINVARLHHLDNPWSVDSAGSLWTPGSQDRINIDAEQLDKLHRLVAALKEQGIYSNVNLKVSRTHTIEDGFPDTILQTPQFQKRIDYFQSRIVELQKDFARQLLTTVNPYTGYSLAEDPAVAAVEINNENSLLGMRTRDIGAGLHLLPQPFKGELQDLWNSWLLDRYNNDSTLAASWANGSTPIGENTFSPVSRWFADAQPGNQVIVESSSPSKVHMTVKPGDGVRWRSAAYVDQLQLVENATYTVTFSARACHARPVELVVSRDEAAWRTDKWRSRGLRSVVDLNENWTRFRFVFVAHSVVDLPSRFSIIAGHAPGEVWVKDLRIESGSETAGLQPGQSVADGSIPIPTDATPTQWNDWLSFLVDTEVKYVLEMRDYLRDELGVLAPIVCTQANYGGIAGLVREAPMDFIDAHAYWQHPDFGGMAGTWNTEHYTLNNSSQIAEFSPRWFGELGGIALLRVTGKPFTVTEVDYPAPHEYAAEMYPLLATFGGFQDWDGIYTFDTLGVGEEPIHSSLRTFFDQNHHPAKWGFSTFSSRVFRLGLVPPPDSSRELFVSTPFWEEANHVDVLWLKHQSAQELGFLSARLSVNENLLPSNQPTHIVRKGSRSPDTIQLRHARRGVVYTTTADQAEAIVGFIGDDSHTAASLNVTSERFGLNFGAVTLVSLDDQSLQDSRHMLITLAARAGNQGMQWNPERSSVGEIWGQGEPTIAEHVPATVSIQSSSALQVFPLSPNGARLDPIPSTWDGETLTFSTSSGNPTLHYEVAAQ